MTTLRAALVYGALAILAGCGTQAEESADDPVAAADSTAGMAAMQGMEGTTMDPAMAARMQAHLQRMSGLGADSMLAMRSEHRREVANLLAAVNQEMRDMAMAADAAWTATVDSVRGDLTRMPEMSGAEMRALMPDHRRRVERLVTSHEQMMAQMGH